jgi:hypothetical protein
LWTAICPISGSGSSPAHCLPICLSSLCLLKVHMEISSLPLPLSLVCLEHPAPLLHVPFHFLVYYSVLGFFLLGGKSVCSGGYAGLSQGVCGNTVCCLFAHVLVCWMSLKQVCSKRLVAREPYCFLSVTWHGEALYGLGSSGCPVFYSSW